MKSFTRNLICLAVLACTISHARSASLFGDHTCADWGPMPYSSKKDWTNAFLAPLSLTYQGLKKTSEDRYNNDPQAFEHAILSIDHFCDANPKLSPADGAASYLQSLVGH